MNHIVLQPAFILHARPYRDSSFLLDVFSQEQGRVHLVARGVRSGKNKTAGILQPFSPLLLSWQGKTDLMTLVHAELQRVPYIMPGEAVLCGFYLNEVLVRVLQKADPCPRLYRIYESTLQYLTQSVNISSILRLFEKHLLSELGYALPLEHDVQGRSILPKEKYVFIPALGFKPCAAGIVHDNNSLFSGESLLALQQEHFPNQDILREIKHLMQMALLPLLGEKPLKSRECFVR